MALKLPEAFVRSTMIQLNSALQRHWVVVSELFEKCLNNKYQFIFPETEGLLLEYNLINSTGIPDDVKKVVLCAIKGRSLDVVIGNPRSF